MKEVLVYGGAFNPPTRAHGAVIEACLQQTNAGELWVMPSADRADKQFEIEKHHRLEMLQLMLGELSCGQASISISRIEIDELPAPTETAVTHQALREKYPQRDFRFIFGADAYNSMPDWQGGSELQQTLPMLVMPRNDEEIEPRANVHVLEPLNSPDICSTDVRNSARDDRPIDELVHRPVSEYIQKHGLYRS